MSSFLFPHCHEWSEGGNKTRFGGREVKKPQDVCSPWLILNASSKAGGGAVNSTTSWKCLHFPVVTCQHACLLTFHPALLLSGLSPQPSRNKNLVFMKRSFPLFWPSSGICPSLLLSFGCSQTEQRHDWNRNQLAAIYVYSGYIQINVIFEALSLIDCTTQNIILWFLFVSVLWVFISTL